MKSVPVWVWYKSGAWFASARHSSEPISCKAGQRAVRAWALLCLHGSCGRGRESHHRSPAGQYCHVHHHGHADVRLLVGAQSSIFWLFFSLLSFVVFVECAICFSLSSVTEFVFGNRTSVMFVSISFIVLMMISLAWLVFYYIQRFRYLHAKDRLSVYRTFFFLFFIFWISLFFAFNVAWTVQCCPESPVQDTHQEYQKLR